MSDGRCSLSGAACNLTGAEMMDCDGGAEGTCIEVLDRCYRDFLQPRSATNGSCSVSAGACLFDADCMGGADVCNLEVMLADGDGPYFNGEIDMTGDVCGDVPDQSSWQGIVP